MAIVTKRLAKDLARFMKNEEDYIVGVLIDPQLKRVKDFRLKGELSQSQLKVRELSQSNGHRLVYVTSDELKRKYNFNNTIKDLEAIVYKELNERLTVLKTNIKSGINRGTDKDYRTKVGDIFYVNTAVKGKNHRFYKVIEVNDDRTYFIEIRKKSLTEHTRRWKVVPLVDDEVEQANIYREGRGDTFTFTGGKELYLWDGEPLEDISGLN